MGTKAQELISKFLQQKTGKEEGEESEIESIQFVSPKPYQGFVLGYLRPGDRFEFVSEIRDFPDPSVRIRLGQEYVIVGAPRGSVAFATGSEVITVSLEYSLQIPVYFESGPNSSSKKRFLIGDQIRHRTAGITGVVDGVGKTGYLVRFSGSSDVVEYQGEVLALINKEETTRNYIQPDFDEGSWYVRFGSFEGKTKSLLAAIKLLRAQHPAAFNRWSNYAAKNPGLQLQKEEIRYLIKIDPRVWSNQNLLKQHGYVISAQNESGA